MKKEKKESFQKYELSFSELKKSLEIISSKDSSLDDVLLALDNGLNAHKTCVEILADAERRVKEISLQYTGGGNDEV